MKRFFALIFLTLYLYNFVGYLAVFSVLQYRVKKEVKHMLMASVPEAELIQMRFPTSVLFAEGSSVQWLEPTEFRYRGGMYDVVRMMVRSDTTIIHALRDDQEERLFADLDNHVQRHMGSSAAQARLDVFQEIFKDSFPTKAPELVVLAASGRVADQTCLCYLPITLDIPAPPPRFLFNSAHV